MTLVSSGEISIGGSATSGGLNRSINIELGRSATATSSLNETSLRTLAGVASGAISLSNFYGKSNLSVTLPDYNADTQNINLTLQSSDGFSAASEVSITLNSNGSGSYSYIGTAGSGNFTTFTWLTSGSASDCYAYMDAPSGDSFTSGTTGSSLQLNSSRSWILYVERNTFGISSKTLTSTIRIKNAGGTDLVAKTLELYVEAEVV